MKTPIESLIELTDIQCTDGTWDYDPYMHGMANGMLMAISVMTGEDPNFKTAPETWLCEQNIDYGDAISSSEE